MATPGSSLPEGYVLGAMSHADRVGIIYDAHAPGGGVFSAHVLHPLHVDELREWFEANALRGKALRHPNLVEVLAVGETHNQLPVMVTERVEGRTLRARVAAGDLLVGHELGRVVRAVSDALDYLHGQVAPVLHRALMPENVICTTEGAVKLLAVGHAECPRHAPVKPSYLSPEELRGAPLYPASDVFSLASLTFELLTGRPAFAGGVESILGAVQRESLPNVGVLHSEALAPINRVLHRAWTASPRDRTPRAGVFAAELEDALRRVPSALLAVRRNYREGSARGVSSAPRAHPSSAPPVLAGRHPSLPAPPRASVAPAMVAARRVTPAMTALPVHRAPSGMFALPPPPRMPAGLAVPEPPEGVFELHAPRGRQRTPERVQPLRVVAAPAPSVPAPSAPAPSVPAPSVPAPAASALEAADSPRTRVDTDDAVLILEPALVDAAELPPQEVDLPPLESVLPAPDDDAPEVVITDDPDPSSMLQRTTLIEAGQPARTAVEPAAPVVIPSAPAVMSPVRAAAPLATLTGSHRALSVPPTPSPTELLADAERRPSWTSWRPQIVRRPSDRPWHARELRLTPRVVGVIIVSNLVLTAMVVALLVILLRR